MLIFLERKYIAFVKQFLIGETCGVMVIVPAFQLNIPGSNPNQIMRFFRIKVWLQTDIYLLLDSYWQDGITSLRRIRE